MPGLVGPLSDKSIIYNSYAGADIVAEIVLPGEKLTLGELQTISYSIHRENTPVRFVGHVSPMGWVKGPRTIAGSLIFTMFYEYAFYRMKLQQQAMFQGIWPLADMLPPFDVVLTFSNEYGSFSKMRILGCNIVDEGGTFSIDDLVSEQTYSYMARGIIPMTQYSPDLEKVPQVTVLGTGGTTAPPTTIASPTPIPIPTSPPTPAPTTTESFVYTQSSPASVWVITHNLGFFPNAFIIDSDGNTMEGTVRYLDANRLTITFSKLVTGEAFLS